MMKLRFAIGKPGTNRLFIFPTFENLTAGRMLIMLILLFSAWACSDDETSPENEVLVDETLVLTRTASELQTFISASGIDVDPATLKYDAQVYRTTYNTSYKGSTRLASGLVILPKTKGPVPMVSFQHGTIVAHADAPTAQPINSQQLILYSALASAGFIVVVPDYLGFGESTDIFHPYYVEEATADAVIDNIRAGSELSDDHGVRFNKNLFLAGYSQGGYATMATHKALETDVPDDLDLIASFPASGGYDVKGMQEYFFSLETYHEPFYIPYVVMSYRSYYDWQNSALSDFFNEPFASEIPSLYDGTRDAPAINAALTESIPGLIREDLLLNIDSDPAYSYLTDAFTANSVLDWTPSKPIFMYHGTADVTVPFQNSVDTYENFVARGSSLVTFIPLEGADHSTAVVPYIEDFFKKLQDLNQ